MALERVPVPDCQARATARAKAALLWGVLAFLAGQGILAYIVSRSHPEIRDPEYGYRLRRLREQASAAPGRPLFLILGSSRTLSGICPPSLPPWPADAGVEPRVFNFSQLGAGPVRELLTLRRLLAAGHRPDWLLLEVWPPFWPQQGYWLDEGHIMQQDLRPVDLSVVTRYFVNRSDALQKLAAEACLPIVALRSNLLARSASFLLSPDQRWRAQRFAFWEDGEPSGWRPWLAHGTAEDFRARIEGVKQQTKPCLDHFKISDTTDRAFREILEECRRQHTKVALILMPEHSELRSWYTPAVHEQINAYLERLRREFQVPVFDTRTWVADDAFHDLTHMAPPAAPPYTLRLGRELLLPWLTEHAASD
ncbi:MAG TPA: hypothetical protein VE999_18790 [Gemmataceae bacterium]|nr:hypothetical protein [Gemmataceae bacterium]